MKRVAVLVLAAALSQAAPASAAAVGGRAVGVR